jgi:Mrp family chromosome partitioning ATPase/capsular polysaccharide biosynthesis protein
MSNGLPPALNGSAPRFGFSDGDDQRGALRYVQALREHWVMIVTLVTVGVLVAALYTMTATKRYEAEASLLVTPVQATDSAYLGISVFRESSDDPTRTVVTLSRIVHTEQAAEAARKAGGLRLSLGQLLGSVSVIPVSQSNLITIKATADNPVAAAAIANGFAKGIVGVRTRQFQSEVASTITRLQRQVDAIPASLKESQQSIALQQSIANVRALVGTSDPTLRIATPAGPPGSPVWPRAKLTIIAAFLATLFLGCALALILELVNPRVNREEELIFEQRLPILARVPRLRRKMIRDYLARREPLPQHAWEAYKTLRMNLAAAKPGGHAPRTILVTSSQSRDGKTITAVNLATSLAKSGMKVILVDCDYRRPMLGAILGVSASSGAPSFLEDSSRLPSLLVSSADVEGLSILPASPENALLVDQIDGARVRSFFDSLSELADVVIVDSAPATEVADTLPLAAEADAVLIAVRLGHTRRDRLSELRWLLAQHSVSPSGFVMAARRAGDVRPSYYTSSTPKASRRPSRPHLPLPESLGFGWLGELRDRVAARKPKEPVPSSASRAKANAKPAAGTQRRNRRRRRRVSGTRSHTA